MSEQNEPATVAGIAVVGMAGRFPGAGDVERFWENLAAGIESVRFFHREELLAVGTDPAQIDDPAYVPARAALDGAELFDAGLFGYTPREAEIMDPQHRLLLECAWEALESAGCDPRRYGGGFLSLAPSEVRTRMEGGVVNIMRGATVGVIFEVLNDE